MEKFKLSIFEGNEASTNTVSRVAECSLLSAPDIFRTSMCSPFVFKDNIRRAENFISTCFMVFDFDNHELPLERLQERLETWPYNFSILTTKSHTDDCHHLRLIIPLAQDITNPAEYISTWKELQKKFPECDSACKDLARLYFKSTKLITSKIDRLLFKPVEPGIEEKKPITLSLVSSTPEIVVTKKGVIHPLTEKFIKEGAPEGKWHDALVSSCLNLKQNGYSLSEACDLLSKPTGYLDQKDMKAIHDCYANRKTREPFIPIDNSNGPLLTESDMRAEVLADMKLRKIANANRQPFLCDAFTGKHELTIGMTVIGADTGRGKSTTASNIAAHFVKHSNKKLMFITNEETSEDIYTRIACNNLNIDWQIYHEGKLSQDREMQVLNEIEPLFEKVHVYRQAKGWDMTDAASVKKLLRGLQTDDRGFGLVVIDYLQTINKNTDDTNPESSRYHASKDFGDFMKDHGTRCFIPTVVFAQLNPNSTSGNLKFSERIQGDKHFANHAVCTIEVCPNFEKRVTTFKFHKSRYSNMTGQEVVCNFVGGKFIG